MALQDDDEGDAVQFWARDWGGTMKLQAPGNDVSLSLSTVFGVFGRYKMFFLHSRHSTVAQCPPVGR